MEENRAVLRLSGAVVGLAIFLRLLGAGLLDPLARLPQGEQALSALIYLQTGRAVKLPVQQTIPQKIPPQTEVLVPAPTQPTGLTFSPADLSYVSIDYDCSYRPDLENLLLSPLDWDLTAEEPTVLIIHSHATECYTMVPGESFFLSGDYRTLDENHNMLSIGDTVARILEERGITVIHDRTLHDSPSYNSAYTSARAAIQEHLAKNPSIRMVLDLHRDASGSGQQLVTVGTVAGQRSAQLMLVVGTDENGSPHPNWQKNLSLALKLTSVLDIEDYLVSNILLPAGSLVMVLFCTAKCGWGFDAFSAEANSGKGMKVKRWMYGYMKYVLPIFIGVLLIISIVSPFADLEKLLFNLFR